jgi:hypothetical protein
VITAPDFPLHPHTVSSPITQGIFWDTVTSLSSLSSHLSFNMVTPKWLRGPFVFWAYSRYLPLRLQPQSVFLHLTFIVYDSMSYDTMTS